MGLDEYRRKRDFGRTPEPRPGARRKKPAARAATGGQFVVQQHAARRMHWDFRLELDGVLKSWAVPKGPSLVAGERRMAAQTEDHPLEYASFEGVIPKGEYGGGTVVVWDRGFWQPIGDPHAGLEKGKLDFTLAGQKLRGRWHLVRMRERREDRGRASWLLIKGRDSEARPRTAGEITATATESVLTGRDLDAVARDADRVWSSGSGERGGPADVPPPGDPGAAPGARRAPLPRDAAPALATLVDAAPEGGDWIHEIKLDGYRLLCRIEGGDVRLVSRNGHDWTDRFPTLAEALRALPAKTALFDGEAVALDARGRSDFQALQSSFGEGRTDLWLVLFDCLYLDGWDLRPAPLTARKDVLRQLLARGPRSSRVRYGDHVAGRGAEFFEAACRSGVEGVVSKRASAPYRGTRTRDWLKVKCTKRQEFAIAGFTEPAGSRVGLGALLLAAHDDAGALRYCGKVGTGFDGAMLRRLRAQLEPLERERPPVVDAPRMRDAHWVEPRLVCEVAFTEWTRDGKVRHPSFMGLREDKDVAQVRIEPELPLDPGAGPSNPGRNEVAGVRLSTPGRVYWPDLGITKLELAEYYEAMAERVLPGMAERPLSLLRCPEGIDGECFYQKQANQSVPEAVPRVRVRGDREPYAMVTDLASLISLVQIGVLEFHVWGARADRLDRPDLLIFDLDPDVRVPWRRVVETASALREFLAELELSAFARVTGGKGVHVVVPLVRRASWETVKGFARDVAEALVSLAPTQFTANMSKAARAGKIYVDYLRNEAESTAIASYSARARPGAPVALPLAWEELEASEAPIHLSIREARARLREPDPWTGFEAARRPLTRAAIARVSRR